MADSSVTPVISGTIEQRRRASTVAELIAMLSDVPPDLPVVTNSEYGHEWERLTAEVIDVEVRRHADGTVFEYGWADSYTMRTHPDREYTKAVIVDASY